MDEIIGRQSEKRLLQEIVESDSPEFVAVYGRRRIGKTFLVKQFFNGQFDFYMTGIFNSSRQKLLEYFNMQLESYSGKKWPLAKSWLLAFRQLQQYLSSLRKKKIVVFIDELPWFDTPKSGFFSALELFWNGWGDSCNKLKFIVCGSATTWMTGKLIGDRGGLHNRVTRRLYLAPFTLAETEEMLNNNGIHWNRHQIVECYMMLGGTPFYLKKLKKSLSLPQNIDRLFFKESGELRNEFDILFRSLFKESTVYEKVVELLSKKSKGLTRSEILESLKLRDGGKFTEIIRNLVTCDFLRVYQGFGMKERDRLYQLTDLFTLFYLKMVKSNDAIGNTDYWTTGLNTPSRKAWAGYAFEQVCLHHIPEIKTALGISGVQTSVSSWIGMEKGKCIGQIDLVIDRRDQIINLCEMKYSVKPYEITRKYMAQLRERAEKFRSATATKKALALTFITVMGLKHNEQWGEINNEITGGDLFRI